ncbi:phosphatidylglycerophosphatase A family protein [Candidatus Synchoanobacter obligatus]|uniref:Phosphatidylglycerophosphatase A n=1 Tax=Candidatus Synchoanobacter obligatus TaxID=2919597 RepID=A0ABT1L5K5_9GAMM|nr:phosphatidylglycerophosphatase A [Candidatus Synchoanobacter obligatus]MCP8352450.1 phosphatidylglycerophosphatase A [Candidatus Synchoanobacter obligatus]
MIKSVCCGFLTIYAHGFGTGYLPLMPGTWGTLPALAVAWLLYDQSLMIQVMVYAWALVLAYLAADIAGKKLGDSDHKSIVCDEIIGILPVLLITPMSQWFVAFLLFRILDIVKPWPISWVDKDIKGASGCLLDDIVAGFFSYVIMALWF